MAYVPPRAQPTMHELRVEKIAPGGRGIAFVSEGETRRAVFLPLVAPGDVVRAEVDFTQSPARGRVLEMLTPSTARVAPPCAVAARCGGCDFMFLAVEAQHEAHASMLRDVLPLAMRAVDIRSHLAPASTRYRTRARIHVNAGKRIEIGFRGAGSHDIVETAECLALDSGLDATRDHLAEWLKGAKGQGEARLALGAFPERRPVIDLSFKGALPPSLFAAFERAVQEGVLAGVRVVEDGASRPAKVGDPTPWMVGADGLPLRLGTSGFGQASDEGNRRLGTRLREIVSPLLTAPPAPVSVVELFAGAGNFTALLAEHGAKVVGVEADVAACEAARANLSARKLTAKIVAQDADAYAIPRGLRLVLLDPPRTGARGAAANIVSGRPSHVVYVSCDPPTLGRDLATLAAGGYVARSIDSFELFPQTSHVETVVWLSRGEAT